MDEKELRKPGIKIVIILTPMILCLVFFISTRQNGPSDKDIKKFPQPLVQNLELYFEKHGESADRLTEDQQKLLSLLPFEARYTSVGKSGFTLKVVSEHKMFTDTYTYYSESKRWRWGAD